MDRKQIQSGASFSSTSDRPTSSGDRPQRATHLSVNEPPTTPLLGSNESGNGSSNNDGNTLLDSATTTPGRPLSIYSYNGPAPDLLPVKPRPALRHSQTASTDWIRTPLCEHCGSLTPRSGVTTVYGTPIKNRQSFIDSGHTQVGLDYHAILGQR